MIKPITPAKAKTKQTFPDEIIKAFNDLLTEKGSSSSIRITQDEAIERALANFTASGKKITRSQIFENNWMDVEDTYRKAGWKVSYDKPGYCESYPAYFIFSKK